MKSERSKVRSLLGLIIIQSSDADIPLRLYQSEPGPILILRQMTEKGKVARLSHGIRRATTKAIMAGISVYSVRLTASFQPAR